MKKKENIDESLAAVARSDVDVLLQIVDSAHHGINAVCCCSSAIVDDFLKALLVDGCIAFWDKRHVMLKLESEKKRLAYKCPEGKNVQT